MDESSRRTALVIGAVVAAAGIAAASYYLVRIRLAEHRKVRPLRSVTEVLGDCYAKMREIQEHLSEINPSSLRSQPQRG